MTRQRRALAPSCAGCVCTRRSPSVGWRRTWIARTARSAILRMVGGCRGGKVVEQYEDYFGLARGTLGAQRERARAERAGSDCGTRAPTTPSASRTPAPKARSPAWRSARMGALWPPPVAARSGYGTHTSMGCYSPAPRAVLSCSQAAIRMFVTAKHFADDVHSSIVLAGPGSAEVDQQPPAHRLGDRILRASTRRRLDCGQCDVRSRRRYTPSYDTWKALPSAS